MRFLVTGKQKNLFKDRGWIAFSEVEKEAALWAPLLTVGRQDFWRREPLVRKALCRVSTLRILSDLVDEAPLRLGYDYVVVEKDPVIESGQTLEDLSPFQGIAGGVLFSLDEESLGQALFVASDAQIPWTEISGERIFLACYLKGVSVYVHKERKILPLSTEEWAYTVGDRTSNEVNPIVFR